MADVSSGILGKYKKPEGVNETFLIYISYKFI